MGEELEGQRGERLDPEPTVISLRKHAWVLLDVGEMIHVFRIPDHRVILGTQRAHSSRGG